MKLLIRLLTTAAVLLMLAASTWHSLPAGLMGGLLVTLVLLCGYLEMRAQQRENDRKPIITVEATVVSHHQVRERVGRNQSVIRSYITFQTTDGQVLEFNVSEIDYDDFDIGETGPLRYRGWQFLSFGVKDKSHIKPIAPLPEEFDPAPEPVSAFAGVREKLAWLWTKLTSRKTGQPDESLQTKDNGILTHELDE